MDVHVSSLAGEPHRIQELWFDGNLIIQAANSQFRMYRGILAAQLIDGCPLVRLPDSVMDVRVILKAIFEPELFMSFPASTDFDVIVGCLRLGHKYGVDYLRRRALIHYSSGYPTTLAAADAIESSESALKKMSWPDPDFSFPYEVFVTELAREIDALWILPRAFYELSSAFSLSKLSTQVFDGAVYASKTNNPF
ncbi:hypothetical protein C8R44DRAFT_888299 [Mycena epipterygia]|nr:hypothetical protein C8R44DRAFT_888299 [Mycena epipterygia]